MDLSIFIRGNGYGAALQYIDNKPVITESSEERTYTIEEVRNELKTRLYFEDWQIKEEQGCNNVKLVLLFSPINQNVQIVIKEMETLGWTKSYVTSPEIVKGVTVIGISFDPLFQPSVKPITRYLFHWSPSYNKDNILQHGLIPSSQNSRFNYPPKVHLLKGEASDMEKIDIGNQLCHVNNNPNNNGEYSLFKIDLSKIPDDVEFYLDPRYEYGVYTKQKIEPNAITYIGSMKFAK